MNTTETIAGIIGLLSSALLAWFAYQRGSRADKAAQDLTANAQLYTGYGDLIKRIQEDNADLRTKLMATEQRLAAAEERIDTLLKEIAKQ